MKFYKIILLCLLSFGGLFNAHGKEYFYDFKLDVCYPVIEGIETKISIKIVDNHGNIVPVDTLKTAIFNNMPITLNFSDGIAEFNHTINKKDKYEFICNDIEIIKEINPIPLYLSIIPPLIAILFALIFKEVFSAILLGVFSGTLMIWLYQGYSFFRSFFSGIFSIVDTYVINALTDSAHLSIIVFTMLIGGTVHLISKNGGMQGIINFLSKYAKNAKTGQLATWLMGLFIFFDDYANTLVVGNTMRPVTDKLKVSREKLAYVVDSTAAPIVSVAFITTWIGAQLSYVQTSIDNLAIDTNAYSVFFSSLKYSFYPFLAIIFVLLVILTRREFGPMYKAELKARSAEKVDKSEENEREFKTGFDNFEILKNTKARAYNAIIPIIIIVGGAIAGLLYTGWDAVVWSDPKAGFFTKLSLTIGNSDSYKALIWASFGGLITAIGLSIIQKIMTLQQSIDSMLSGFKTMLTAIMILILAWSLAGVIADLHTATFITNAIQSTALSPVFIPVITFVVSALVAFSTGSSWGTMAIMYPLILPAAWMIGLETGMPENELMNFFAHVVSTVLAGSVLGDHCSPISDTTILSSLASSCNHIQHVKTQLPYAATVGLVAIIAGTLPAAIGLNFWISMVVGIAVLFLILKVFGKKIPEQEINP